MERWKQIVLTGMAVTGLWMIGGVQAEAAVPVDEATFPDPVVRSHVKAYDKDQDGVLSDEELNIPTQFVKYSYEVPLGSVVDFKGMEHFPNIRELDLRFGSRDYNKGMHWNYGGSDLLQCFPYAEKISISANYIGEEPAGQITLSGTSGCLKEVRTAGDDGLYNVKVVWNVYAKNLKHVNLRVREIDGMKNDGGELSSLESLRLSCFKMQHCNLSFAKMPLLKDLSLHAHGASRDGEMTQEVLRDNGVFPEELSRTKLEMLSYRADMQDYGFLSGLKYLKKLEISGDLRNRKFSLKGLSSLEELDMSGGIFQQLDLAPVKKTLKTLFVGSEYGMNCSTMPGDWPYRKQAFKTLDISQMECLETLYGTDTCLEKIITRDAAGHSALKKLKRVELWYSEIKSINPADMPNLEELLVDGSFSKLDTAKCKNLKGLYIRSNNLKSINLKKNQKLEHFWIKGANKASKLDLSKNVNLQSLHVDGTRITSLDLSKNTSLRGMSLYSALKLKKLTLPALKKSANPNYTCKKRCKVNILDLSRIKKFTEKTRGKYLHPFQENKNYKKIIISKKVKKSDRNWFKKKAKKVKAKVIVK